MKNNEFHRFAVQVAFNMRKHALEGGATQEEFEKEFPTAADIISQNESEKEANKKLSHGESKTKK